MRKKQNNSPEDKKNNFIIKSKANVTNNVCIIINNTDKNESKDDNDSKNIINNISFSNMDNINEDNKRNKYIKITDNESDSDSSNIKQNYTDNNNYNYYNPLNNNSNENDNKNKNKINNEINYIKKTLGSKLKEGSIQLFQQKDNMKLNNLNEYEAIKENINIKDKDKESENKINNEYSGIDDKIKTSSFEIEMNDQNKENNKSLKDILNFKHKELKKFEKEIEKRKKIHLKRRKIGIKEKFYPNINTDNNNRNSEYKNEIFNNLDSRSYSKPINTIRVKNKKFKTFNHNNINNTLNKNKSDRNKEINKKVKKEIKINEFKNLSIDSNEIILSDANINTFLERMKNTKKIKNKPINTIYYKKNRNIMKKEQRNEEKIFYDCDSNSNLISSTNLTFNKSIEKKRHLLGLPINVKLNNNLKKKINKINKSKEHLISKKENKNKIWRKYGKKEEKNINNSNTTYKPLKILLNQRKKNIINKNIKGTIAKKKQNKNDNFNPVQKGADYDRETYSYYNNLDSNSMESSSQLFKSKLNNINKNKIRDNTAYIAFNNSLSSTFSSKTNKTSLTNSLNYTFKSKDNNHINKSNYKLSNYNQFRNNINSKGYIFVTKSENKNFLSTIRLVKKRVKSPNKLNQIEEGEKTEEIIKNNNAEFINSDNIKQKEKEKNNVKQNKELAAIRRINQIKETYKNKGAQITNISKKYHDKLSIDLNNSFTFNNKKEVDQFQTYRILSQMQKNHKYSFSNSGSLYFIKTRSNKSLLNENKSLESFKI